jgi:hypothetical protein
LQTLLDEAFTALSGNTTRAVTKSTLSQARKKVKTSAFQALNQRLIDLLTTLLPEPCWRGLRLIATDSITLRLPAWLDNQAEFGVQLDSSGQPYLLARALGLFATRSRLMLHSVLDRFDRSLLVQLIHHLKSTDSAFASNSSAANCRNPFVRTSLPRCLRTTWPRPYREPLTKPCPKTRRPVTGLISPISRRPSEPACFAG